MLSRMCSTIQFRKHQYAHAVCYCGSNLRINPFVVSTDPFDKQANRQTNYHKLVYSGRPHNFHIVLLVST